MRPARGITASAENTKTRTWLRANTSSTRAMGRAISRRFRRLPRTYSNTPWVGAEWDTIPMIGDPVGFSLWVDTLNRTNAGNISREVNELNDVGYPARISVSAGARGILGLGQDPRAPPADPTRRRRGGHGHE